MGQIITTVDFLLYLHQWFWHIKANGGIIESIADHNPKKNGYFVCIDSSERFFPYETIKDIFKLVLTNSNKKPGSDDQETMEAIRNKFIYALDNQLIYNTNTVNFDGLIKTQYEPVFKREEEVMQTLENLKEKFRDHNDEVGAQLLDGCIFQILSKNKYEQT